MVIMFEVVIYSSSLPTLNLSAVTFGFVTTIFLIVLLPKDKPTSPPTKFNPVTVAPSLKFTSMLTRIESLIYPASEPTIDISLAST